MKISIFGLGYVGCVSGACLAELGHDVIGVDTNPVKVNMINHGQSLIIEKDLPEIMERVVAIKKFMATTDWEEAINTTEIAFVCVGTPSNKNGSLSLEYIKRVAQQIGKALTKKDEYFILCIRSTVLPGTVEGEVIPILEAQSRKKAGINFDVCMVPEFMREGSSVYDFFNPPKTVIGERNKRSGEIVAELFNNINAPLIRTEIKIAEMVKYADNAFHALKVTFANEIGSICKEVGCDSHKVMDIFCKDNKLNLSPYYLKPGFAFGGSCLPKDLRAITFKSKSLDIATPVLDAILESNRKQILKIIKKLQEFKGHSIGFLGLSFKAGTDDLRESPIVEVIEALIGKGFTVSIYDRHVSVAKLVGANKEYIEKEIPHISSLMCASPQEVIHNSHVIVVSNHESDFKEAIENAITEKQIVIDLVRITANASLIKGDYYGISW